MELGCANKLPRAAADCGQQCMLHPALSYGRPWSWQSSLMLTPCTKIDHLSMQNCHVDSASILEKDSRFDFVLKIVTALNVVLHKMIEVELNVSDSVVTCFLFSMLHCADRKTRFRHLLMVSFKNCETLLAVMVFQLPTLFVCSIHTMNHIIGTVVLYPCVFSWTYYFVSVHLVVKWSVINH